MIRLPKIVSAFLFITAAALASAQDKPVMTDKSAEPATQTTDEVIDSGEVRRGMMYSGLSLEEREKRQYQRLIELVEPSGKGDPARVASYIALFKREMVGDTSIFATSIEDSWDEASKTLTLTGYVNYEENLTSLKALFKHLGFEHVVNKVEVLPSENLGKKKFAFINVPHSFFYDRPGKPHERVTEGSLGDPIFLLRDGEEGFVLAASREGYVGYVNGKDILRVDAKAFHAYQEGPKAILKKDFAWKEDVKIFAGSRLKFVKANGSDAVLKTPEGDSVKIPRADLTMISGEPNPVALAAIETSRQKLGTKYVWGGTTSEGVDCSGLVQSGYKPEGINLGRDAYMQAYAGTLVATRWYREGLRPGDLIYFIGRTGKITHTAIYIGNDEYIQASRTVKISSLNPKAENYDEDHGKAFIFAKRLVE